VSPRVSVSLEAASFVEAVERKPPRNKLLACLALVKASGIPLRQSQLGVVQGQLTGEWTVDRATVRGVDALGAVLLAMQPERIEDEDPSGAAARALGVQMAWVIGAQDGWDGEAQNTVWLGGAFTSSHYLNGYLSGVEALCLNTLVCDHCGSRRFKSEARCPGCDR
jgi:hypothetical protein